MVRARHLLSTVAGILGAALLATPSVQAQGAEASALSGTVTSAQEGAMEGVLVSAKKDGSTITTTVVSDDKGHFSFPASRLSPGHYSLKIRAVGYNLDGPNEANIAAGKAATADIKLKKTGNLSAQLTNAEWMNSMPGTDEQKSFLQDCTGCHTLRLIVNSPYQAADFEKLIPKMGTYSPGSVPGRPQPLLPGLRANRGNTDSAQIKIAADYLSTVNLSKGSTWSYPLKTLPRPKGSATHVIITTYDLPRPEAMPHDVIVTKDGMVWYTDFGSQYFGQLDPKTGKVTDYPVPLLKPAAPKGLLELVPDEDGNLWGSMMYQAGVAMIDMKTKKVTAYPLPAEWQSGTTQESMVSPAHWHVDGYVWTNNQENHSILRLNVKTGKYENLGALKDQNGETISGYDIPTDKNNNLFLLEFGGVKIGRIDAKTKTLTTWKTPIPRARPRRGHFDENGNLWFAEYGGNAIGMFDPETSAIKEWVLPIKWSLPYDAVSNAKGEVWTGSMLTDRVTRLDPKSSQFVDYLLPAETNIRRVFFDDTRNALWVGSNHGDAIIEVQPLD